MNRVKRALFLTIGTALLLIYFCTGAAAADLPAPQLTSVTSTANEITVSWKSVKGATGYKLYMKNKEGKFEGVLSTSSLSYTVKGLEANTAYEFRLRSYVRDENKKKSFGSYSEVFTKKTKLPDIQGFAFSKASENTVTVKWNAVENAESYRVYYKKKDADAYTLAGETQSLRFTLQNLSQTTGYRVRVYAKGNGNTSRYTPSLLLYTIPKKANKPELKSSDSRSITIKWDKTPCANKYIVYRSTTKTGGYKRLGTTDKTTYTYTANKPQTTYYFKIRALVDTANQTTRGEASAYLKAKTGNITISVPSVIRKGEYPSIKVDYYKASKVKWKSSDTSVIKLKDGKLFCAGTGTATLTATYGNCSKKITVKVTSPVLTYMSGVYDVTNKSWVFESRINERCYPASITKLITALVALKYMSVNDTIVVGDELNMVEALSSRCNISRGEKFRLGDLLYGLLLPSGGDAAYTIAVNCARKVSGNPNMGYIAAKNYFVKLMNDYMKSIGATGTNCVNPHGYPVNGHYSTVHDLMLVARKVLQNPTLKKVTSTSYKYVKALTGKGREWRTTNSLLVSWSSFYSPYAHGMKTGTVNDEYTGIISAATKDNRTIITVVIGCESYNARYRATHKLYNAYL